MNTLNSLKCAIVLLPALAMGIPMANASDEKRNDPGQDATHHYYLETMPVHGYYSNSLIGHEVKSRTNDESIGKVNNLLLDENDKIIAVVISVGGVLGIGERDVAIAWDQVERRVDGDDITLWVNLTEQDLKDAKKFSSETTYSRGEQQRTDRAEKRTDKVADRADKRADMVADRAEKRADQQGTAHHHYVATLPARGFHSDRLVGQDVKSRANNETIGTVSNFLMDENGQVVAVVVGIGGFLGIGERDVAIAWDQVERSFDGDELTLWVNLTEESLKDAPKYESEMKRSRSRR
jgi:hypothetical protein